MVHSWGVSFPSFLLMDFCFRRRHPYWHLLRAAVSLNQLSHNGFSHKFKDMQPGTPGNPYEHWGSKCHEPLTNGRFNMWIECNGALGALCGNEIPEYLTGRTH